MRIINRKDGYDIEKTKKDLNDQKNAASKLMNIKSKKGENKATTRRHGTNLMMTIIVRQWPNKQTTTLNMTETV